VDSLRCNIFLLPGIGKLLELNSIPFHYPCSHEYPSIPALDGGHVMFLLYEIIARRKPGDKFLEYAQLVGMAILLALILYANINDVVKLFR
jgi:hypothetical protein